MMLTHEELVQQGLSNPAVKAEYESLAEDFTLFERLILARQAANLTTEEVAKRMGTSKAIVSRLESFGEDYKYSPSLKSLRRYAEAVGCQLEIKLVKSA